MLMKRKLFPVLCLFIIVISFSGCAAWKTFWADDPPVLIPQNRLRKTVATYVNYVWRFTERNYSLFEYEVNGVLYRFHSNKYGFVPGEKFMLQYDELDPGNNEESSNMELLYSQPVFLTGERTAYTWGELLRTGEYNNVLSYTYRIDGVDKDYHRTLYLPDGDIVKNHPQLLEPGAKFVVEYWLDNPKRSILYIDMPVNDTIPFPSNPYIYKLRPKYSQSPVMPIYDSIKPLKDLQKAINSFTSVGSNERKTGYVDTLDDLGCDIIYFKSGKEEYCRIFEINSNEIIYKMCDYHNGATITVNKDFIDKIKYADGQEDFVSMSYMGREIPVSISPINEGTNKHSNKTRIQLLAIPSFILSLLSIGALLKLSLIRIELAFLFSLIGLILGVISLDKINRTNKINKKVLRGRIFAAEGMLISYIVFILILLALI